MVGFIKVDKNSTLKMELKENSTYVGAINFSNVDSKKVELEIDSTSKLYLTSNCYLTKFKNEDTTNSNIVFGKYKIYVNGKEIN